MADKNPKKSEIDADLVRQLAGLLDETGLSEIEYGTDEWHLRVARGGIAVAAPPVSVPEAAKTESPGAPADDGVSHADHPGVVVSPMVGTAYTTADPETPPFVKIGDQVAEGDTLILIEAMKVFNPIKAAKAGKVTRVFIGNGTPVEFGEPLMIIE
ncbi:MAG: acetyl-CoA carboxylase biotin carboxyl carrier protein [Rhodospirillaceae bacterium]|nr:acetyl-CoA carboxylase biotin carboxyl carrier protein [Rhodospirillaceae bacterium]MBL6941117.1 acetyl-CoA carboxylase biotin carboxyl carrier protein [Rhodospirillales bacterium]